MLENVENPRMYSKDGKKVEPSESIKIREVYFRECEELVKKLTVSSLSYTWI